MFTDMQFEVVDLSKIRTCLASYPPELRDAAIEAIYKLSRRIRRSIVYMAPDTGWFNVEREGLFTITYQAFVDRFDLLNIETEDAPFDENLGAFVVRRSGMIRYLRVRGWGNGPSAEREYHSLLFGLNGIGRGTRFLIPNLLSIKDRSLVIIDPKGELMAVTAAYRRTLSEVAILNPFSMLCLGSKGFNPLALLDPASPNFYVDAAALGEALICVEGKDPHWGKLVQGLLVALIMWERMRADDEANRENVCVMPSAYGGAIQIVDGQHRCSALYMLLAAAYASGSASAQNDQEDIRHEDLVVDFSPGFRGDCWSFDKDEDAGACELNVDTSAYRLQTATSEHTYPWEFDGCLSGRSIRADRSESQFDFLPTQGSEWSTRAVAHVENAPLSTPELNWIGQRNSYMVWPETKMVAPLMN